MSRTEYNPEIYIAAAEIIDRGCEQFSCSAVLECSLPSGHHDWGRHVQPLAVVSFDEARLHRNHYIRCFRDPKHPANAWAVEEGANWMSTGQFEGEEDPRELRVLSLLFMSAACNDL